MDAKFYILKSKALNFTEQYMCETLTFTENMADYGEAVYVRVR